MNPAMLRRLSLTLLLLATLALVLWLTYPLLRFIVAEPKPAAAQADPEGAATTATATTSHTVHIDRIIAAELFGTPVEAEAPPVETLQETHLDLRLTGVLSSRRDSWSRAIIDSPEDRPRPYAIGDELPGEAGLKEIHARFVILERDGRRERLTLPEPEETDSGTLLAAAYQPPPPGEDPFVQAREALAKNPDAASQFFRLQPVRESQKGQDSEQKRGQEQAQQSQIKGFRYYPGTQASPLHNLGARTGDVITHINSVPVDDPDTASQLMDELIGSGRGNFTVERRGERHRIAWGE